MDDDDEIQSHASPSPPNGRITVTVAAAAPVPTPSSNTLTLALPIQHHKPSGSGSGSGGGREDCWSEAATAVLIDAWGERYLELSRGNLKQKHWKEVADIVSSRDDYSKTPKTDIQCKNRIDTVKKKYKIEKAKIAGGGPPSTWRFFHRLDELIGPTANPKLNSTPDSYPDPNPRPLPTAIPVGIRSSAAAPPPERFRKRPLMDSDADSSPDHSADSSDGLPPQNYSAPAARLGILKRKNNGDPLPRTKNISSWRNSMQELSRAILKFGQVYEQAETSKLQQLVEIEKQRMKFAKDLELQRMQYFMKAQLELSQFKNHHRRHGGNNNNNNNHHNNEINNNNDDDDAAALTNDNNNNNNTTNNNNNSDSSN